MRQEQKQRIAFQLAASPHDVLRESGDKSSADKDVGRRRLSSFLKNSANKEGKHSRPKKETVENIAKGMRLEIQAFLKD